MDRRIFAIIVISYIAIKRRNRRRRLWIKEWVKKRQNYGFCNMLLRELKLGDESLYKNFIRMSHSDFNILLEKVTPIIKKKDTMMRNAITPEERLILTLRFLATGDSYHSLMYLFRIPVQTISLIIPECCQAIFLVLRDEYLKIPSSESEWNNIACDFEKKWNFPHCIGALDGKHIVIQKPADSGSTYFNYKQSFSIVLMALVDANYKFIYVDVGCNGRISDGGVFQNCTLSKSLENNSLHIPKPKPLPGGNKPIPFVIVADDAFPLNSYIMKPYPFKNLSLPNRIFNYRLSRARRIVENAFGLIANRFRILRQPMLLEPKKVKTIVLAITCLHNFLMSTDSRKIYAPPGAIDIETEEGVISGNSRNNNNDSLFFSLDTQLGHNYSNISKKIREEFTNYFVSTNGEVPWQYKFI